MDTQVSCAHVHGENAHHRRDDGARMSKLQQSTTPCRQGSCHRVPPSETLFG
jgi:hypothetical protein